MSDVQGRETVGAVGAEVLTALMVKWGCGQGAEIPGESTLPIYRCRSKAHEPAYWGNHCGFAGDAASSALVVFQNRAAALRAAGVGAAPEPDGGLPHVPTENSGECATCFEPWPCPSVCAAPEPVEQADDGLRERIEAVVVDLSAEADDHSERLTDFEDGYSAAMRDATEQVRAALTPPAQVDP